MANKQVSVLIVVAVIVITSAAFYGLNEGRDLPIATAGKECYKDNDCITAGCSGQLCVPVHEAGDIFTTCEWREDYTCLELTSCGCFEGKCQFEQNEDYTNCLARYKTN